MHYLVELVVKLTELRHFLHHFLAHEEGSVERGIVLGGQLLQRHIDQRLLQEHQWALVEHRKSVRRGT